jgi:hypothetical protein
MADIVLPRKDIVDGKGNVWEWLLENTGWNELPLEEKIGAVVDYYELLPSKEIVVDIKWKNGHTSHNVFPDELRLLPCIQSLY